MIEYILAAAFALSLLIFTHELGHFLVAKLSGIRVLKFSMGFGPVLVSWRRRDTEYAISAIPFGGFVKMAGEGGGDEEPEARGEPWEFSSKPVRVRLAVVLAGPAMNFALAVVIAIGVIYASGVEYIDTTRLGSVAPGSIGEAAGLETGDEVLSVGGTEVGEWNELVAAFIEAGGGRVAVVFSRGDSLLETQTVLPDSGLVEYGDLGISPFEPPVIGKVRRRSPAHRAGLKPGDEIVSLAGTPVAQWAEVAEIIHGSPGVPVHIEWIRDGVRMEGEVIPEEGDIPVSPTSVIRGGLIQIRPRYAWRDVSFPEAVSLGFGHTVWLSKQVILFIRMLFTGGVSRDMVGGPIRIGQMAGETVMWGISELFFFIAYLSVVLFILNLLPIPVLDGGHVLFLAIEAGMRRPLSLRVRTVLQQVGFVLLILLMVVVAVLDLDKLGG